MPIENRKLEAGTRLVTRHKGKEHVCEVVQTEEGLRYRVAGKSYNSPSSAGVAVTGGVAVNGWKFWSLAGDLTQRKGRTGKAAKKSGAKTVKPKGKKVGAKGRAKKTAARASSHHSYGCGVCPRTFPTMNTATQHAREHASV